MEDEGCPRCKTTKYRNPSLKLLVNICGHALCENCVELLFVRGSNACPECNIPLRRNNYRIQLFDSVVEKELDIRKRILKCYNKKEEDFETLDDYNNYLEEVECIIHNLVNDIDAIETNRRIEEYKKENRDLITKNKQRISKEQYELEMILDRERELADRRKQELHQLEVELKKRKTIEKEALIDELMFSHDDATSIVKTFVKNVEEEKKELESASLPPPPPAKIKHFSTGIQYTSNMQQQYYSIPKVEEGPLFVYQKPTIENNGPNVPTLEEVVSRGFVKHIRTETPSEKASGFQTKISCQRALQEAMQGLFQYN